MLVLGGDVAGKAIQSIVRGPNGLWHCTVVGHRYELSDGSQLAELERLIADHGYYPYRAEPGELEAMQSEGTLDDLFLRLMRERLAEWLDIADTRLRPKGVPLYLMLGNDDPPELADMLDRAPWGVHAEGKVVQLDDEHEMISWATRTRHPGTPAVSRTNSSSPSPTRPWRTNSNTPNGRCSTCTHRRTTPSWMTRRPSTTT